ncbi:MAG TPA: VCBS repeat-containing protein [Micromonosporaceae bacterium]|nr:VCBS repeat-containing protein [Micromonosporaceae bacterium]
MTWWSSSVARRWAGGAGVAVVLGASAVAGPPPAMAASCAMTGYPLKQVAGDWDGDGDDTPGLYDRYTATWYLRDSTTAGAPQLCFRYGRPFDDPVIGDWDGNGTDTVGVVRRPVGSTWLWILNNSNAGGGGDVYYRYGPDSGTQAEPITGDWDGDGDTDIGVVESGETHLRWRLRRSNETIEGSPTFGYGLYWSKSASGGDLPPNVPVVGDWDGDGADTVGVVQWSPNTLDEWHLRNSNTPGNAEVVFPFGNISGNGLGANMVAGDWNGDGYDDPGYVSWAFDDDPATPYEESHLWWALRRSTSGAITSFPYGTLLAGIPTTGLTPRR